MKRTRLGLAVAILLMNSASTYAQDQDGDGVIDSNDAFPCLSSVSGISYAPAQGQHSLLLFEDQYPADGDLDFNDFVLATNYIFTTDAAGQVTSLRATFNVLAHGGIFHNGLGLHLPVPRGSVASVTKTTSSGTFVVPLEVDAEATMILSKDARALFSAQGQLTHEAINSVPGLPISTAEPMQVDISFSTPVSLNMGEAPFDTFIVRTGRPGLQVHRPAYAGTAAMDTSLFNSQDDTSSPGRWFTGSNGLPFALLLPLNTAYPQEGVSISTLYPNIVGFAQSGGATNQDFTTSAVVSSAAFAGTPAPTFVGSDTLAADTSCVPAPTCSDGYQNQGEQGVDCGGPCGSCVTVVTTCPPASVSLPASCLELSQAGVGTGTYCVDADGPNGLAPVVVYCDQDTLAGGWTAVTNVTSTGPAYQSYDTRSGSDYIAPMAVMQAIQAGASEVRFHCGTANGRVIDQRSSDASWMARPTAMGDGCANGYRYAANNINALTPVPGNNSSVGGPGYGGGCCCRPNYPVGLMTVGLGQAEWFMYDPYYRRAYPTCAGTSASFMRIYYR